MEISILPNDNKMEISEKCFGVQYNETLVHQVITSYQSNLRSNSSLQKNRSQVSGGGKKPWRQKGTGRARAGTTRGPIWRGGGVTFATGISNFNKKINKKMTNAAIITIISELFREQKLVVVDIIDVKEPKTKLMQTFLDSLKITSALFVTEEEDNNILLASRNIKNINVISVNNLNPLILLKHKNVVFTKNSLTKFEERYGN
jgi:large subunit ribosomal protein L4